MGELLTRFRITTLWYEEDGVSLWTSLEMWFEEDWERLLDIIHVVLQRGSTRPEELDQILSLGAPSTQRRSAASRTE
jgi:hypothetical protein